MNIAARLLCVVLFLGGSAAARGATGTVKTLGGSWTPGYVDGGNDVSLFNNPWGLTLNASGKVFIADFSNNAIRRLDPLTEIVSTFTRTNLSGPMGVVFDSSSNLLVANFTSGIISRYDNGANALSHFATGLTGPTAIATDSSGNVYVALIGGVVRRFNSAGAASGTYTVTNGTPAFRGVAVVGDGILASDAGNHVIWRIPIAGGPPVVFAGILNAPGFADGGLGVGRLNSPHQIAVTTNGVVVVADRLNHRVRGINSIGVLNTLYGADPVVWRDLPPEFLPGWLDGDSENAELHDPVGVAIDNAGIVYDSEVFYGLIRGATGLSFPTNSTGAVELGVIITPARGVFSDGVRVTITSATDPFGRFATGVKVFYSTDGSDPVPGNPSRREAIIRDGIGEINLSGFVDLAQLRVRAFSGEAAGPIAEGEDLPLGRPVFTPNEGFFPTGVRVQVLNDTAISPSGLFPLGTRIFYTTNGTVPTLTSSEAVLTNGFAIIDLPGPISLEQMRIRAFVGTTGGDTTAGRSTLFDLPQISPKSGYFPTGQIITVSNANAATNNAFSPGVTVHYTTDGTEPTTADNIVQLDGSGVGQIFWHESDVDLTFLRVKAFNSTNASVAVTGIPFNAPPLQGELGIPPGRNGTNYLGAPGARIFLPVIVNLPVGVLLESVSFVVQVTSPQSAAAGDLRFRIDQSAGLEVKSELMSTNDFIPVKPASTSPAVTVLSTTSPRPEVSVNRLGVAYLGPTAISVNQFAVVAMISVPIPQSAPTGPDNKYTIEIRNVTGQSAGGALRLRAMPPVAIEVRTTKYLVGDTSPHFWYNAGDFGDRYVNPDTNGTFDYLLDNSDVNDAFFATITPGGRRPYPQSDVYNAMDSVFEDQVGVPGGDGEIRFLDWNITLRRSLGFDQKNWRRFRVSGLGLQTELTTNLVERSFFTAAESFGPVAAWDRAAILEAGTIANAIPGSTVSAPVYLKVDAGSTAGAFQFVTLVEGAPGVQGVTFVTSAGVPAPSVLGTATPSGSIENGFYCAWNLDALNLKGSTLLGHVKFKVPENAPAGASYSIRFLSNEGASTAEDGYAQYKFEGLQGKVWVSSTAQAPANQFSDEWKLFFFGTLNEPAGFADEDADHDGFTNLAEFKAGFHPLQSDWRVRIEAGQVRVRWFAPAGNIISVDRSADLNSWSNGVAVTNGDDAIHELAEPLSGAKTQFYRIRSAP